MMLRYISSLLLFFCFFNLSFAQVKDEKTKPKDTQTTPSKEVKKETPKPKEKFKFRINGIRLSHDLSAYVVRFFDGNRVRYELGTEVNISNALFVSADFGLTNMRSVLNTRMPFEYVNKGNYMRFGIDYNFLHKTLDKQSVFVGAHYGRASFSHTLDKFKNEAYWTGFSVIPIEEKQLSLQWIEAVVGLKTNVYRGFMAGFTIRYQIEMGRKDGVLIGITDVPGFGRTDNSHLVMNYHLIYEYAFKKKN